MPATGLRMNEPATPPVRREERVLWIAFLVSLLLHAVGAAVTWRLPLTPTFDPAAAPSREETVELVLVDDDPAAAEDAQPQEFKAVPDRHASETAPEDPDYLALHHSLAADNKLGDSEQASADLEDDSEQVAIQRENLEGAEGVAFAPERVYREAREAARSREGDDGPAQEERTGEQAGQLGSWALPDRQREANPGGDRDQGGQSDQSGEELAEWWSGQAPSVLREGESAVPGDRGFDFNQDARGHVTSGVAVVDNFRLNTYAWEFGPWIHAFANELHRHWRAPYSYAVLGIGEGTTEILLVVEKDGRPSSMEVTATEGNSPELHSASMAALKAFAPYAALPPDFPEENLVIQLRLSYPAWRR